MPADSEVPWAGVGTRSHTRLNALCIAKLIDALLDGPLTYKDLSERCGLHEVTIRRFVKALRAEGAARIGAYEFGESGVQRIPAFVLGRGPDAKRPPPKSIKKVQQEFRARKKLKVPSVFDIGHVKL